VSCSASKTQSLTRTKSCVAKPPHPKYKTMKTPTIKVRFNTTLEVDPVAWIEHRHGVQVKSKTNVQCRKVALEVREACAFAINQMLEEQQMLADQLGPLKAVLAARARVAQIFNLTPQKPKNL
jgi:hypothetical protein